MIRKSIVLSAFILGFSAIAGSAQAATISCPGVALPAPNDRMFTLTTDPGSVCRGYGPGNISGNNDPINDTLDGLNFWTTLDKSDEDITGLTGLTVTGVDAVAGTFSFLSSVWSTYNRIIIGLKSGEGQHNPDWAAFELVEGVTSGNWTISFNQSLSHINLYGHLGGTTKSDDPGPVPEPASLFLFGSGVALVARKMRRRTA